MSSDTKWVIGTVVTLAGVMSGLMLAQFSSVNGRIDDLRSVVRGMDERLRVVEVGQAEVEVLISGMDERLRVVEVGQAEVEVLISGMDERLRAVENGLSDVRVRLRAVENGLSEVDVRLRAVENGLGGPEPGDGRNPAGP